MRSPAYQVINALLSNTEINIYPIYNAGHSAQNVVHHFRMCHSVLINILIFEVVEALFMFLNACREVGYV